MRMLVLSAGVAAFPLASLAQIPGDDESAARRALFRYGGAARSGTYFLPRADDIWMQDGIREGGRERNYWHAFRQREKARLLGIERAATARAIAAAKARAAAYAAFDAGRTAENVSATRETISLPAAVSGEGNALVRAAQGAAQQAGATGEAIKKTTQALAEQIEKLWPSPKAKDGMTAGVFIALVVIFILPALVVALLGFGLIRFLRTRRSPASR